ncbi:ATP-binding protein [Streptomyces sp. WMMB 322]|uniref:ATP-binding protein n=1 Tax=Streptomyces sp. WMMB 322 TaxID=1286821 RepID=UPI0006E2629D|nr:ATP-binding protein [Streptomyces sp. WMMB 322]SCK48639.1 Histidine kinase-like ATPase domain-containing protein [Streptomyces sp. WMMB 322]
MNGTMITSMPNPGATVVRGDRSCDVHKARDAARAFADSLTPAPDGSMADTLVLVVSELVTNALRHGGGRYTLELSAGPDALAVAVSDLSPAGPCERTPDRSGGSGGFGWHMIRSVAGRLTITLGPGPGKTIRVRLPRELRPEPEGASGVGADLCARR